MTLADSFEWMEHGIAAVLSMLPDDLPLNRINLRQVTGLVRTPYVFPPPER